MSLTITIKKETVKLPHFQSLLGIKQYIKSRNSHTLNQQTLTLEYPTSNIKQQPSSLEITIPFNQQENINFITTTISIAQQTLPITLKSLPLSIKQQISTVKLLPFSITQQTAIKNRCYKCLPLSVTNIF